MPFPFRVGESAPIITLPDQDGNPITLPDRQQANLLVFYRGDW